MTRVDFGVQPLPQRTSFARLLDFWQRLDDLGYDSLWTADHLLPALTREPVGPAFEGWTALAALAVQVKRARVGCLVSAVGFRHPALLAKMAVTLDHATGGRLDVGIGGGWYELEFQRYGIPFGTRGERSRRLAEQAELLRRLFTEERVTFRGRYYRVEDAPCEPRPLQQPCPPIWVGGGGEQMTLRTAARFGDAMNTRGSPETMAHKSAVVDQHCRACGRDPAAVRRTLLTFCFLTDSIAQADNWTRAMADAMGRGEDEVRSINLVGTPAEVRERLEAYAAVGITHVVMQTMEPWPVAMFERFAAEVMPHFR